MALRECPECRQSISDTAERCPSCGYQQTGNPPVSNAGRKSVLIIAVCLGAFGALVGFSVGNPAFGAVGAVAVVISGIQLLRMQ